MRIENFKWWHWMILGTVLGAAMAGSRVFWGYGYDRNIDRTLQNYFERDVLHSQNQAVGTGNFARYRYYFKNVVVHPPDAEEMAQAQTYLLDVRDGERTVEISVRPKPNNQASADPPYDKNDRKKPLTRLPVFWNDVPLAKVPAEVKEAAMKNVPAGATVVAAAKGPAKVRYWVSAVWMEPILSVLPAEKNDPKAVPKMHYEGKPVLHEAKVPYEPDSDYDYLARNAPGLKIDPAFDAKKFQSPYPTILTYLDALKAKYPELKTRAGCGLTGYRYAWWEEPKWTWALWTGGSALAVGVIWPMVLALLTGAGFGRAHPKEELDLSRFKGASKKPVPAAAVAAAHARDMEKLLALEAQLEQSLLAGASAKSRVPAPPPPAREVVQLNAAPAEVPKGDEKPKPVKTFGADGGDFYPTEVHGVKKKT